LIVQPKLIAHFLNGSPSLYKPSQTLWIYLCVRRVGLAPSRLQPMLLQPVADRRFVLAGSLADRFEGHSLCQTLFEELLLHGEIISVYADGTMRRQKA